MSQVPISVCCKTFQINIRWASLINKLSTNFSDKNLDTNNTFEKKVSHISIWRIAYLLVYQLQPSHTFSLPSKSATSCTNTNKSQKCQQMATHAKRKSQDLDFFSLSLSVGKFHLSFYMVSVINSVTLDVQKWFKRYRIVFYQEHLRRFLTR